MRWNVKMDEELTDIEKNIAEELLVNIKAKVLRNTSDEKIVKIAGNIVKLSNEGLTEEEIIKQLKIDGLSYDSGIPLDRPLIHTIQNY